MEQHADAGRAALALERPEQAIAQYQNALARAHERDDAAAIGDFGFNLAVAQLHAGEPDAALTTARETEAHLARRGVAPIAALQLAEAIALYRLERPAQADALAGQVETASDRDIAARAAFLRGLVADDAGNIAGLRAALGRMGGAREAESEADEAELSARLSLREGDAARARAQAERAIALRRDLLDYRSLARCLALAAQAASLAGDNSVAAQFYLRAGLSAAAKGDKPAATRWLGQAIGLGGDPQLTQTARATLAALRTPN
jgi:tetratricopeptide (TPR) repeat protein